MYYTQKSQGSGRVTGIVFVTAFHAALFAGLLFIKRDEVAKILEPMTTEIIEQVEIPEEEPPPPPPLEEIDLAPPPDQVVLPEIQFDTPPPPSAITQVTMATDPAPPAPKPGPVTPKPAPPGIKTSCNLPKRIEKPPYPSRSERLNEEGITTMRVCVTAKGRASEAVVTQGSGYQELDDAAVKWAMGLRNMQPAKVDGQAVDGCCMVVPLAWEIEEGR